MRRSAVVCAAVAGLLLVAAVPAGASPARETTTRTATGLEHGILAELNEIRHRHGLAPVRLSPALSSAARAHTSAMLQYGFFDHDSRDGTSFSQRVRRYYSTAGYRSWAVAENLLWASPDIRPAGAVAQWMSSPPHRRTILDPRWRDVGLGAARVASAPGAFGRRPVTAVTADFGVRR